MGKWKRKGGNGSGEGENVSEEGKHLIGEGEQLKQKVEMKSERGRNYSVETENGKEEEDTCKGQ